MPRKKIVLVSLAIVFVLALALGAYFYWPKPGTPSPTPTPEQAAGDLLIDNVNQAVLPDLNSNPLQNKPDINPAEQGNPFNNVKTNPFE